MPEHGGVISVADKAETREVVLHEDVLVASGFVISRRCLEFRASEPRELVACIDDETKAHEERTLD